MRITRRKALLSGVLGAPLALFGLWWLFPVRQRNAKPLINAIMERHLSQLEIAASDRDRFIADLTESLAPHVRYYASWAGLASPAYPHFDIASMPPDVHRRFRKLEEHVVDMFLMNSDFFANGEATNRRVHYRGLPAGARACGNPFANLS